MTLLSSLLPYHDGPLLVVCLIITENSKGLGNVHCPLMERASFRVEQPTPTEGKLGHLQAADPGLLDGRREGTEHSCKESWPPRPARKDRGHSLHRM